MWPMEIGQGLVGCIVWAAMIPVLIMVAVVTGNYTMAAVKHNPATAPQITQFEEETVGNAAELTGAVVGKPARAALGKLGETGVSRAVSKGVAATLSELGYQKTGVAEQVSGVVPTPPSQQVGMFPTQPAYVPPTSPPLLPTATPAPQIAPAVWERYQRELQAWQLLQQAHQALQVYDYVEAARLAQEALSLNAGLPAAARILGFAGTAASLLQKVIEADTAGDFVGLIKAVNSLVAVAPHPDWQATAQAAWDAIKAGKLAPAQTRLTPEELVELVLRHNNATLTGTEAYVKQTVEAFAPDSFAVTGAAEGPGKCFGIGLARRCVSSPLDRIPTQSGNTGLTVWWLRQTFERLWTSDIRVGQIYGLVAAAKTPAVVDMTDIPTVRTTTPSLPTIELPPPPEAPTPVVLPTATPLPTVAESGLTYDEWVRQQQASKAAAGQQAGSQPPVVSQPVQPVPPPPPTSAPAGQGCWSKALNRWVQPGEERTTWNNRCVQAGGEYKWVSNK